MMFRKEHPEFDEFIATQQISSVANRKKVIEECQRRWRLSRKRRKMSYGYKIVVSVGDLFKDAFAPVTWNSYFRTTFAQHSQKPLSLNMKVR